MSQENREIVQSLFERWNARDMDGLRELYDPDVIVRAPEGWPEPGPFVGPDAVKRQWNEMRETWNADLLEPVSEFIGSGDRVVGRFIWRATGHGPDTDLQMSGVWTVRRGKIVYNEFFWDHAEALKAVGLAE
jgi:ketosteroid isomerase-like protein